VCQVCVNGIGVAHSQVMTSGCCSASASVQSRLPRQPKLLTARHSRKDRHAYYSNPGEMLTNLMQTRMAVPSSGGVKATC
jgi:hypothetical protein